MRDNSNLEQGVKDYIRFQSARLTVDTSRYQVHFHFPVPAALFTPSINEHFCREVNLYKEDVGLFHLIVNTFAELATDDPAFADFFVLPLNLIAHEAIPESLLQSELSRIRDLQATFNKKLILFSCSDFNHRGYRRST